MTKLIKRTAIKPIMGVTRRPHLQEPDRCAVSDPAMYPRPLKTKHCRILIRVPHGNITKIQTEI
jgi:hypothetical protein